MKKLKLTFRKQTIRTLDHALTEVRGGSPPSRGMGDCPHTERESCNVCDLTIGKCSVICI